MKASATTEISLPTTTVFEYVSDPHNMPAWVTGVDDVDLLDDPTRVGARFESDYTYGNRTVRMTYEVTAYEPDERYATRGEGPFPFAGELTLEPTSDGTRVTNTIDAGSDGILTAVMFTVLRPVARRLMERRLREELDALRAELEGQTVAAPSAPSA
jgi:carbon monoxide dehydrogenase subunit G